MNPTADGVAQRPVLVIMGVSGSGKSTIAGLLAGRLGWDLEEGDDLCRRHPRRHHMLGPQEDLPRPPARCLRSTDTAEEIITRLQLSTSMNS